MERTSTPRHHQLRTSFRALQSRPVWPVCQVFVTFPSAMRCCHWFMSLPAAAPTLHLLELCRAITFNFSHLMHRCKLEGGTFERDTWTALWAKCQPHAAAHSLRSICHDARVTKWVTFFPLLDHDVAHNERSSGLSGRVKGLGVPGAGVLGAGVLGPGVRAPANADAFQGLSVIHHRQLCLVLGGSNEFGVHGSLLHGFLHVPEHGWAPPPPQKGDVLNLQSWRVLKTCPWSAGWVSCQPSVHPLGPAPCCVRTIPLDSACVPQCQRTFPGAALSPAAHKRPLHSLGRLIGFGLADLQHHLLRVKVYLHISHL